MPTAMSTIFAYSHDNNFWWSVIWRWKLKENVGSNRDLGVWFVWCNMLTAADFFCLFVCMCLSSTGVKILKHTRSWIRRSVEGKHDWQVHLWYWKKWQPNICRWTSLHIRSRDGTLWPPPVTTQTRLYGDVNNPSQTLAFFGDIQLEM